MKIMRDLRPVEEVLPKTKVILRLDLDLPMEEQKILDNSRLVKSMPTIKVLLDKECRLVIIGHRGRPKADEAGNLSPDEKERWSLRPVYLELVSIIEEKFGWVESVFVDDIGDKEKIDLALANNQIVILDNLRFRPGEEKNDGRFLEGLTEICQFFVNDAFAGSHRQQASIMLYKKLPGFYGRSFIEEVEKIKKIIENPQRPLVIILGGAKKDKLEYLPELKKISDKLCIGGKLPMLAEKKLGDEKVVWGQLKDDGLDISQDSQKAFREEIMAAGTVIWVGAMGYYESKEHEEGTLAVAKAMAGSEAYKVIAGGDTRAAVKSLELEDRMDYIASGGGAMLELICRGSLPAWD